VICFCAGDGWNGDILYFTPGISVTLPSGSSGVEEVCLPPGVYSPYACGGSYSSETSWEVVGYGVSGGADASCSPSSGNFTISDNMQRPSGSPTPVPSSSPTITSQPTASPTTWFLPVVADELEGTVVLVTSILDALGNASLCTPQSASSLDRCNVRSAVEYCCTLSPDEPCSVVFSSDNNVGMSMNASLGEIVVASSNDVTVYGQGATLSADTAAIHRFMTVLNSSNISLLDMQLQGFGDSVGGGALHLSGVSGVVLERVRFRNNIGVDGGAVNINTSRNVTFTDCLFEDNFASGNGGAIHVGRGNDYVTINGCGIKNNTAMGSGGGMFVYQYNDFLTVNNSNLISNSAASTGGGLHVDTHNDHLQLHNSVISHCSADVQGGGVYVYQSNYAVHFQGVTVENCASVTGEGAGMFVHSLNSDFLLESSSISRCASGHHGGGLYAYSNDALRVVDTVIAECTAAVDGGGLYFSADSLNNVVSGCSITSCSAGNNGRHGDMFDELLCCCIVLKGIVLFVYIT
jgi:predicted outer membrane repeat protein